MRAVLSVRRYSVHKPQIGFVHQGRALERMAGTLPLQVAMRDDPQLCVNEGQQRLKRLPIPRSPLDQEFRDGLGRHLIHGLTLSEASDFQRR